MGAVVYEYGWLKKKCFNTNNKKYRCMNKWQFILIHTDNCECTGKELPWRLMHITKINQVTNRMYAYV